MISELQNAINYTGQERGIRKLAISDKLAKAEDVAVMTCEDVCALVEKKYKFIAAMNGGEELLLVEKAKMQDFYDCTKTVSR